MISISINENDWFLRFKCKTLQSLLKFNFFSFTALTVYSKPCKSARLTGTPPRKRSSAILSRRRRRVPRTTSKTINNVRADGSWSFDVHRFPFFFSFSFPAQWTIQNDSDDDTITWYARFWNSSRTRSYLQQYTRVLCLWTSVASPDLPRAVD